jgi:hypothetical protein
MSYCPVHDPILCAGARQCMICGAVGFPLDAEWIDDIMILVSYEGACRHARAATVIVDTMSITAGSDIDLTRYVRGRRCAGRTRRGRPCRAYARPGSDFCGAHPAPRRPGSA